MIAGDENADPYDGDSYQNAIRQLTEHPLINARDTPSGAGAVEASALQAGANLTPSGRPEIRHGRLRRHRTGQPARRLRPAPGRHQDRPLRRLLAGPGRPAVPADRRLRPAVVGGQRLPDLRPPPRLGRYGPAPGRSPLGHRRYGSHPRRPGQTVGPARDAADLPEQAALARWRSTVARPWPGGLGPAAFGQAAFGRAAFGQAALGQAVADGQPATLRGGRRSGAAIRQTAAECAARRTCRPRPSTRGRPAASPRPG